MLAIRLGELLDKSTLNKLLFSRRQLEMATENLSRTNEISLGVGVGLLQDSVELFLLGVIEHLGLPLSPKMKFEGYLDLIDKEIAPKKLPFRTRLLALNKLRVNTKHHGLVPAASEVEGLVLVVREFLQSVTVDIIGVSYTSISLIDLLREGEAKEYLARAEKSFGEKDYFKCIVDCRKAIYTSFERRYDSSVFRSPGYIGFFVLMNKTPYYARNPEYLEEHIYEPTDYIILDHKDLEFELMKSGVDGTDFWNVWRLTPSLFRKKDKSWVVKHDFRVFENEGIPERAEYVLDTTLRILVSVDEHLAAARSPESRQYYVCVKSEGAAVYKKADRSAEVVRESLTGGAKVFVDYIVEGLDGAGDFYHIVRVEDDDYLLGFLSEDDVEGDDC